MAKQKSNTDEGLPFFKFHISKWALGAISDCSLSAHGLFIKLCIRYWNGRGNLSYSKTKKAFPRKQKLFTELLDAGIFTLNGDQIEINFLTEQLIELGALSEKNSKNAKTGWEQRKLNATASLSHDSGNAVAMLIEEKRKEEEENRREQDTALVDLKRLDAGMVEKANDLTDAMCEYFDVKKILTSPMYDAVLLFVSTIHNRNELDIAALALKNYVAYKGRSQQQPHSLKSWIGEKDDYYRGGQWIMVDWEKKNKSFNGQAAPKDIIAERKRKFESQ